MGTEEGLGTGELHGTLLLPLWDLLLVAAGKLQASQGQGFWENPPICRRFVVEEKCPPGQRGWSHGQTLCGLLRGGALSQGQPALSPSLPREGLPPLLAQ